MTEPTKTASLTEHRAAIQAAIEAAEADGYVIDVSIDEDICCYPDGVNLDIWDKSTTYQKSVQTITYLRT